VFTPLDRRSFLVPFAGALPFSDFLPLFVYGFVFFIFVFFFFVFSLTFFSRDP